MGVIQFIKEEIQVIQERDPAIKSPIEVILYPAFRVMLSYRRAHRLYQKGHFFRARLIHCTPIVLTPEISPNAGNSTT